MKLTYVQLEQHLSRNLAPIYIINGDELLLKHDAIQSIRKAASKAGFSERIRMTPEAGFDEEQLHYLLNTSPLFATKQLLELDFRDHLPNKIAGTILQQYAEAPHTDNILLIDMGKAEEKITKSTWYQALEKKGVLITVWPLPQEQFPQWIVQRFKKYKLQIDSDAAHLLADMTAGNLIATANTVEKIYLLRPSQPIKKELIHTILIDESHFTVFDFVEQLIAGNKIDTLHSLERLRLEHTEPTLILWGITRELRLLADMAAQLKQGATHEQLFKKHRIFFRRQKAARYFLSQFTAKDCWHYLAKSAEIDKIIKGATKGNVWHALQLFCLDLLYTSPRYADGRHPKENSAYFA